MVFGPDSLSRAGIVALAKAAERRRRWGIMLRLAVRACKGDEEGHNLVFMSYGDFCTLAGGGHHESVRVVLQVRIRTPPPHLPTPARGPGRLQIGSRHLKPSCHTAAHSPLCRSGRRGANVVSVLCRIRTSFSFASAWTCKEAALASMHCNAAPCR